MVQSTEPARPHDNHLDVVTIRTVRTSWDTLPSVTRSSPGPS